MIRGLTKDIQRTLTAVLNGEEVDVEAIENLMVRARGCTPEAGLTEVRKLHESIGKLEVVIRDRYQEVGEELRRLGQGRQALRGYNHLRGLDQGQRLYRRA